MPVLRESYDPQTVDELIERGIALIYQAETQRLENQLGDAFATALDAYYAVTTASDLVHKLGEEQTAVRELMDELDLRVIDPLQEAISGKRGPHPREIGSAQGIVVFRLDHEWITVIQRGTSAPFLWMYEIYQWGKAAGWEQRASSKEDFQTPEIALAAAARRHVDRVLGQLEKQHPAVEHLLNSLVRLRRESVRPSGSDKKKGRLPR